MKRSTACSSNIHPQRIPRRATPPRLERLESRVLLSDSALVQAAAPVLQNPSFETTFGVDTVKFANFIPFDGSAVFQADGKLILGGSYQVDASTGAGSLVRLNTDGSIDKTFGADGVARIGGLGLPQHLLVQPDGKIVFQDNYDLRLHRVNADGTLDGSFHGASPPTYPIYSIAMALAPNGDILVAGTDTSGHADLVAYRSDGSPDASFGYQGQTAPLNVFSNASIDQLVVGQDGKITLTGGLGGSPIPANGAPENGVGFVARFNSDGSADATFNHGSPLAFSIPGQWWLNDLQFLPDGKMLVVVAGSEYAKPGAYVHDDVRMMRLNPDGSKDSSFGSDGILIDNTKKYDITDWHYPSVTFTSGGDIVLYTVGYELNYVDRFNSTGQLLQSDTSAHPYSIDGGTALLGLDGRIWLVGDRYSVLTGGESFVARFPEFFPAADTPTGPASPAPTPSPSPLDPTFGDGGTALLPTVDTSPSVAVAASQPDGGILIAVADAGGIALTRLNSHGSVDQTFGVGGIARFDEGSGDAPAALCVQSDGKIVVSALGPPPPIWPQPPPPPAAGKLWRLNTDGSIDAPFGNGGSIVCDSHFQPQAIIQGPDGTLLVAGIRYHSLAVVRYLIDGITDASFGEAGWALLPHEGPQGPLEIYPPAVPSEDDKDLSQASAYRFSRPGTVEKLIVSADGRITIGVSDSPSDAPFAGYSLLYRLNGDGSMDPSFNAGQPVATQLAGYSANLTDLQLLPDGKLLAVGYSAAGAGTQTVTLTRYNADGSPDTTFGTGGTVTDAGGENFMPTTVTATIAPAGGIALTGFGSDFTYNARFTADGTLIASDAPSWDSAGLYLAGLRGAGGELLAVGIHASHAANGDVQYQAGIAELRPTYPVLGPQQIGPLEDPAPAPAPTAATYQTLIVSDRATLSNARRQRTAQLHQMRSALNANAAALRTLRHRAKVMAAAGRATDPAASAAHEFAMAAMSAQLAQSQAGVAAERSAIVSFSRSDLTGVFAAKRQLAADIQGLRHAQRAGN